MIYYYKKNSETYVESSEQNPQWIHLENPTSEEIERIYTRYQFPKDYLTAVLDNQEISRHEGLYQKEFIKPILLLLQYPRETLSPSGFKQIETFPFSIIITKEIIITATKNKLILLNTVGRTDIAKAKIPDNEKMAIQIAWQFSTMFNNYIKELKKDADNLEKELLISVENKQLYQVMDMQKSLTYFKSALEQNVMVLSQFYESSILMTSMDSMAYVHDIMIETKQALASAQIQLELITQLGNMFSAIISNNLNIVMKVLASVAIVLTIPTIMGGVYGMNVALPFSESKNAFWLITLATILLSLITIWILKKKKFF